LTPDLVFILGIWLSCRAHATGLAAALRHSGSKSFERAD
jgi:hypothetical protein